MSETWATLLSYRLHDLLMFSAGTYFGLFELVNRLTWPAPLVGQALALTVLWMAARWPASPAAARTTARVIVLGLALTYAAVAGFYFRHGFDAIHWLGPAWTAAFVVQAVVCVALAVLWARPTAELTRLRFPVTSPGWRRAHGLALLVAAAAWPALPLASQRPLWQAEIVGLAPDATVLLSLGSVLLLRPPLGWAFALLPLPLTWSLFSGATLWALQQPHALVLPLAGAATLLCVLMDGRLRR